MTFAAPASRQSLTICFVISGVVVAPRSTFAANDIFGFMQTLSPCFMNLSIPPIASTAAFTSLAFSPRATPITGPVISFASVLARNLGSRATPTAAPALILKNSLLVILSMICLLRTLNCLRYVQGKKLCVTKGIIRVPYSNLIMPKLSG